jgi:hypothetical protein
MSVGRMMRPEMAYRVPALPVVHMPPQGRDSCRALETHPPSTSQVCTNNIASTSGD